MLNKIVSSEFKDRVLSYPPLVGWTKARLLALIVKLSRTFEVII